MAQLNYPCCHPQNTWMDCKMCDQHGGSNMSLNMPPNYPMNPMWMGTWHGPPPMYPYPAPSMGHLHHDGRSCSHSRPPSPTHSVKSRKSLMSKKSRTRNKYRDIEDTDEEDLDDRRSVFSHTDRAERKSGRFADRQRLLRDTVSMPREVMRHNSDRSERVSVTRSRRSVRESSSDSDDELEVSKDSMVLDEENESVYDNDQNIEQNVKESATAVQEVPKDAWECEHCTFVNEPGTRVCTICCKTPTTNVKLIERNSKTKNLPSTAKQTTKQLLQPKNVSSDDYSKDNSETESVLNKLGKLKVKSPPSPDAKKGRTNRKISFWPGTKFAATFQSKN